MATDPAPRVANNPDIAPNDQIRCVHRDSRGLLLLTALLVIVVSSLVAATIAFDLDDQDRGAIVVGRSWLRDLLCSCGRVGCCGQRADRRPLHGRDADRRTLHLDVRGVEDLHRRDRQIADTRILAAPASTVPRGAIR